MPLMAGLFVVSRDVVLLLLGEKWIEVSALFSILAIVAFIQPVSSLRGLILLSSGQSRRYLHAGLMGTLLISLAFVVGINWGVEGVAWGYVISVWLGFLPLQAYSVKGTSIRTLDAIFASSPAFITSLVLGLITWYLRTLMPADAHFLACVVTGGIVAFPVLAACWLTFRKLQRDKIKTAVNN